MRAARGEGGMVLGLPTRTTSSPSRTDRLRDRGRRWPSALLDLDRSEFLGGQFIHAAVASLRLGRDDRLLPDRTADPRAPGPLPRPRSSG